MKATRCCCPKESFDTEVSRFSAIPSASNNQAISASERRPVRLFFDGRIHGAQPWKSRAQSPGNIGFRANGSAGRSTPRRSTREYPGHRKESFLKFKVSLPAARSQANSCSSDKTMTPEKTSLEHHLKPGHSPTLNSRISRSSERPDIHVPSSKPLTSSLVRHYIP